MAEEKDVELLTAREAADVLRVGVPTLRGWVKEGRTPFVRLGRRILFDRDALLRWLKDRSKDVVEESGGSL